MPEFEPYGINIIQKHQIIRLDRIASFCRNLRLASGYTQNEMAELSGLSRSTIQSIEHSGNMKLVTLFKFIETHSIRLDQFFQEIE